MATKGDKTRERILAEASKLIRRKGLAATTVDDLLAATGLRKGSLYFHFANKQQIGLAVLRRSREHFMAFLDSVLSGDNPGACLGDFFDRALAFHRQSRFEGGCLFGNTALETSDTNPEAAALVAKVFADWLARVQQVIERAQAAGQVRVDLPAQQLAECVVAVIEGGIMQARLTSQEGPLARCLDTLKMMLRLRD